MEQNGVVCQPEPALLVFIFRFENWISGPKPRRGFRETGPRRRNAARKCFWDHHCRHADQLLANSLVTVPEQFPARF